MHRAPLALCLLAACLPAQDWLLDPAPFAAGAVVRGQDLVLDNGLLRRTIRLQPNAATIGLDQLVTGASLLRAVEPEAIVVLDSVRCEIGGLQGQPNRAWLDPRWLPALTAAPGAFRCVGHAIGPIEERFAWKRARHHAPDAPWPPRGVHVRLDFAPPDDAEHRALQGVRIEVHHELYDGLPLLSKWLVVRNTGATPIRVDSFQCERLAAVEHASLVDGDPALMPTPNLHVETDYSFGGGMMSAQASGATVRWMSDPGYQTQVHYPRQTPCLLEVGPAIGPGVTIAPGASFTSCRVWILAPDSTERERRGLAIRRMYRTIAPWVTENPLMMHVRFADWPTVQNAIDQCAEVGFEMVILTFGSGFDIENQDPAYLAQMRKMADHARSKGIEIGGYSLLASRSIDRENDVVMPEGQQPRFGHSPCLGSHWGQEYFGRLYRFFDATGFLLLEHDGSYPGDVCASTAHPGHQGLADSQWTQWQTIAAFYRWCRGRGVSLNVPDWYYLNGSTKCGMGYRETNWSLPRAQQVIHTRQNIFDGTWEKTPSMGWMFVPLTQYHGGGEAATIEPLHEHLDHYRRMLEANLGAGVQACWRGPRLFDTDATRELVKEQVRQFKAHRDLLESDVMHGRRADGRDLDWLLHVNPRLEAPGLLAVWNPLDEPVTREIEVDLYYTGLRERARVSPIGGGSDPQDVTLDGRGRARVRVSVGPQGHARYLVGRP